MLLPFLFLFFYFFLNIDFFSYKQHFATFYVPLYAVWDIYNKCYQTVVSIHAGFLTWYKLEGKPLFFVYIGYLLCIHSKFGLFLLCIYYSPWKHTLIFIYSSWQLSMEHFPLAICYFQTTFLKTRIKATEVWILATSAGHLKYWRYGKTREFRIKSPGIFWRKI